MNGLPEEERALATKAYYRWCISLDLPTTSNDVSEDVYKYNIQIGFVK